MSDWLISLYAEPALKPLTLIFIIAVFVFAAYLIYKIFTSHDAHLDAFSRGDTLDTTPWHRDDAGHALPALLTVLLVLVVVGATSWASLRDEQAKLEERIARHATATNQAAARQPIKMSFNQWGMVEASSGPCVAIANPKKRSSVSTCAE
jgi:tellurite resistance protein TehA-like permease